MGKSLCSFLIIVLGVALLVNLSILLLNHSFIFSFIYYIYLILYTQGPRGLRGKPGINGDRGVKVKMDS